MCTGSHQLLTFLKIGTRGLSNSPLGWLLALLRRLRVALANFSAAPDRALKNWSAAPASPPCFRRWRRSALLLFKSLCEDRKRPAHECVPAHPAPESKRQSPTVDIPTDWDPRTKESPTGAFFAALCAAVLFKSRCGDRKRPAHLFVSGLYPLISAIVTGSYPHAWSIRSSALIPNIL